MRTRALLVLACLVLQTYVGRGFTPRQTAGVTPRQSQPATIDDIRRLFASPPDDSRIMMRWWWFGPAVTNPQLERELRTMRDGGIGGVEIQPVYPLLPDDEAAGVKNLPFLSDPFIDALRFAATTARALGMRVDVTVGSGWPYGGAQVPIDQAAAKLRIERVTAAAGTARVPLPAIGAGERLIASFASDEAGRPQQLTEIRDGMVQLADSGSARTIVFFIASRTGMMVKRAAVGAEGYVLDHFSRPVVDKYLVRVGDRLMQAFDGTKPDAVFCDSLEVYESDWSADFLDEFRRRRGYDLTPHLPELAAPAPAEAAAPIREDWAQTLSELLSERFLAPMQQWAHAHGTRFRVQDYGTPPATLASNAVADLPEGEGAQWRTLSATRWASSASHIFGRPVTSSETWTWLHSPVFRATPLDMKAEADLHFLQGINQLIGHGWPYTAAGVEYPGWRFYASAVFNDRNPWWIVMPDIARYLQRVSFLLRQGEPANDVAVYLPTHDAWASMSPGRVNLYQSLRDRIGADVIARVLDAGFGFDVFDDDILRTTGKVEPGGLRLGTRTYRTVLLPGVERMPAESLRMLERYVGEGGGLIATRRTPAVAPGFLAKAADHAEIRAISQRLFGAGGRARLVAREDAQLTAALAALRTPDVTFAGSASEIGFVHRQTSEAEIYFLANTSNVRRETAATFRVGGMDAEWWDPMSGQTTPAVASAVSAETTTIPLLLEAYGSTVLVFSRRGMPIRRAAMAKTPLDVPSVVDISTGWTVRFRPDDAPIMMTTLRSWIDDPSTRDFSGIAQYSRDVTVPDSMLKPGAVVRLDLGQGRPVPVETLRNGTRAWLDAPVREAAVVFVNDRRAGSIWSPPYALDVTPLLRRGVNRIRIDVANLAVNYMAARPLPDYRLLNLRYGVRFEPQDMDRIRAVDAGLLGPVTLVVIQTHRSNP